MKIKFLGTLGYFPTEHRHVNCVMLPEEGIVLDAGTAFFRVRNNLQTKKLNILLSHYHPDHIHGLTFMLGMFYDFKKLSVNIYGPEGIKDLEKKLGFHIKFKDNPFNINLKKIEKEFTLDDIVVKTKLFPHADQVSAGYRLEKNNKVLCYLTDLIASDDEIGFVKNADLLIHECYFGKSQKEFAKKIYHSYTMQVAQIAKEADVKLLALYHTNPRIEESERLNYVDECKEIFQNTILPSDNQEVAI